MLLVHTLSTYLIAQILVSQIIFVALLCTFSSFSMSCFRYGLHTWMQYSNCGLTNVLYNLSIVSLSLVTMVLLIIPKVELAFLDASAHCLDGFALHMNRRNPRNAMETLGNV